MSLINQSHKPEFLKKSYLVIVFLFPTFNFLFFFLCSGNGKLASWTSILGFVIMMSLDVGLG